jgi:hypothetical protein
MPATLLRISEKNSCSTLALAPIHVSSRLNPECNPSPTFPRLTIGSLTIGGLPSSLGATDSERGR